ncbi:MAG: ABC transporter substrate-binding protein, partial [Thermomicrobiales bacterium]
MTRSIHTRTRTLDELFAHHIAGRLDRRQFFLRAMALGATVPMVNAMLGHRPAAAQTPVAVELGNHEGKTLRLTIAFAEVEREVFEEVAVNAFKEQTGAEVEVITIEAADAVTSLQAQVPSGNIEIDLVMQDNNTLGVLVAEELVEELPEAAEIIPAETIPALVEAFKFDGMDFFLPARPNVQITYYNSALFEEWGLETPTTWDELSAAGQTIKDNAGVGKLSIQGVPGGPVGVTITQFIWQAGGDPLTVNSAEGAAAFEFMASLKDSLTPQYPTATFDTTNTYILNESVVLAQNWPFGVNVIVQEGGKEEVLTYAGWEGPAGNALVLGGDVFGIVKGSPNRDVALDFAKFFMSKEVQETLTTRLGWPAIREDAFGSVEEWQQPYFDTISIA